MPTNAKTPKQATDAPVRFAITREITVGELEFSHDGTGFDEPIRAALDLIGRYEHDHPEGGTYHVPATPVSDQFTVTLEFRRDGDGLSLAEWLQHNRPHVWSDWTMTREAEASA